MESGGLVAEQIQYNSSIKLASMLNTFIVLIWSACTVPKSWCPSLITCLNKNNGNKIEPRSYRGLHIAATRSKIFIVIIIERLRPSYE